MQDSIFIEDYFPVSEAITPSHPVRRPKFDVVDAHNHLPLYEPGYPFMPLNQLLPIMDEVRITAMVNLSGGWGDELVAHVEALDNAHPGKFYTFCNVDWQGVGTPGWAERTTERLAEDVAHGAKGLKIFKELGLRHRDTDNKLVQPNDPRISDVFDLCGELGIPVLIHSADPKAFFKPLDRFNERWDELHSEPTWSFYGSQFPTFEECIESLYSLIEAHPATTFIVAHAGCYPENLAYVSAMLDQYPNFVIDISARIAELGRVPYSSRALFLRHPDRIMYGSDFPPDPDEYRIAYRFLETADEYFTYTQSPIKYHGRFNIYGIHLPDDVLEKVYNRNFHRLFGK